VSKHKQIYNDRTKSQINYNTNTTQTQTSKYKGKYKKFVHNTNNSNPSTTPRPCEPNPKLASEFTQKLNIGRAQNPLNFQQRISNAPNAPVKRQRESASAQYKMDTGYENFLQPGSESESDSEEVETPS